MKREQLIKRLDDMLLSGKDPFDIVEDLANFIEREYSPKKDKSAVERWILDTEKWITDWIELFPEGVKGGTKLLRSDKKICLTKMAKFRQDYPEYTIEDIFDATSQYINEQQEKDYAFTMPAVNFIQHRDKGSELAARCHQLKSSGYIKSEIAVKLEKINSFFL